MNGRLNNVITRYKCVRINKKLFNISKKMLKNNRKMIKNIIRVMTNAMILAKIFKNK